MSEAPFNPGDVVCITTTSWRRLFTVRSSNSHRTTVTGPRGAERVLVLGGDGQWSIFAYGRDRARSRPCSVEVEMAAEPPTSEDDHPGWLSDEDVRELADRMDAADYDAADKVIRALGRSTFLGHAWSEEMGPTARQEMRRMFAVAIGTAGQRQATEVRRETSGCIFAPDDPVCVADTDDEWKHFAAGLDFAAAVRRETNAIADMLIRKNAAYGNSALDPVRIFSQADPVEQIRVRIDDKLSRLQRGTGDDEDTVGDLSGYLVLLRIAEAMLAASDTAP